MSDLFPSVFCDWITIRQSFPFRVPVINGGHVVSFEPDAFAKSMKVDQETGETILTPVFDATKAIYTTSKRIEHEGSFDTKVHIRSDGETVEFSGNASRFGRPDNLFGLSVPAAFEKASDIVQALGCPRFSENIDQTGMARNDCYNNPAYNARITRVDLTQNYFAGSREKALKYIHAMAGQAGMQRGKGNHAPKGYGNGVTWNEGSKRWYSKLYFKADELGQYASEKVYALCNNFGVCRFEVSLKARELADLGLNRVLPWCRLKDGMDMAKVIYGKFAEVLHRNHVSKIDFSDMPQWLARIARDYYNGEQPWDTAPTRRTAQRWRKALLGHGIDIAVPLDVTRIAGRIEVIELSPLAVPDWYGREAA